MAIVRFDLGTDQVIDSQKVITSTWSNNTNALITTHTFRSNRCVKDVSGQEIS